MDEIPQDLSEQYAQDIPKKIENLRELLKAYSFDEDENSKKELFIHVHRFAGSAGTYGYPLLSEILREMEGQLKLELSSAQINELTLYIDRVQEKFTAHGK